MEIMVSSIPLSLEPGSKNSLDFLQDVMDANDEAFYTDFSSIIDYKWKK